MRAQKTYLQTYGYPFDPQQPYRHMQPPEGVPPPMMYGMPYGFPMPMGGFPNMRMFNNPVNEPPPSTVVFVGNVPPGTTEDELTRLATPHARVQFVKILHQKGCAFLHFDSIEDATKVKNAFQGAVVRGQPVRVGFGRADPNAMAGGGVGPAPVTSNGEPPSSNLWVGGVPDTCTPEMLQQAFAKFGAITRVKILTHKNCAFVNFEKLESAQRARNEMNNSMLGGQQIRVNYGRPSDATEVVHLMPVREEPPPVRLDELPPEPADPPSDTAQRQLIEKLAAKAITAAPEFMQLIMERHRDDPRFAFLRRGAPDNMYYRWLVYIGKHPEEEDRLRAQHSARMVARQALQNAPRIPPPQQQPQFNAVAPPPQIAAGVAVVQGNAPPRFGPPVGFGAPPTSGFGPPMGGGGGAAAAAGGGPPAGGHESGLSTGDVEQLCQLLATLQPTKDSIRNAKNWFMERAPVAAPIGCYLARWGMPAAPTPDARINIVYLINDVLHHAIRRRERPDVLDDISRALLDWLGLILSVPLNHGPDEEAKVMQILGIWRDKQIFDRDTIDRIEMDMRTGNGPPPLGGGGAAAAAGFLDRMSHEMAGGLAGSKRPHESGTTPAHRRIALTHCCMALCRL